MKSATTEGRKVKAALVCSEIITHVGGKGKESKQSTDGKINDIESKKKPVGKTKPTSFATSNKKAHAKKGKKLFQDASRVARHGQWCTTAGPQLVAEFRGEKPQKFKTDKKIWVKRFGGGGLCCFCVIFGLWCVFAEPVGQEKDEG